MWDAYLKMIYRIELHFNPQSAKAFRWKEPIFLRQTLRPAVSALLVRQWRTWECCMEFLLFIKEPGEGGVVLCPQSNRVQLALNSSSLAVGTSDIRSNILSFKYFLYWESNYSPIVYDQGTARHSQRRSHWEQSEAAMSCSCS